MTALDALAIELSPVLLLCARAGIMPRCKKFALAGALT